MRTIILVISIILMAGSCSGPGQQQSGSSDQRVDSLLNLMTLEEKIGQLNQYSIGADITGPQNRQGGYMDRYRELMDGKVGSLLNFLGAGPTYRLQKMVIDSTRLGIPLLFAYDVIHGYQTAFPIPLAESASWNLKLMEKSARIAAIEASAAGLHWTFAPMVDISRDARWGRVMEGAGEDPYLGSHIARARIRGFQGSDLSQSNTILATAKHFAAYGLAESGKDYNTVNIGKNTLMNLVMPPFEASVDEGVATLMNAFNDIDGVPATSNTFIQRDLLKGAWQFPGAVVSDWGSIGELMNHRVAKDKKEAARLAITAGSDIDMESVAYIEHLQELVEEGSISESLIDDAVRRVLKLKFDLGLFDDPFKYCDTVREAELMKHPDHLAASREVARESIVLLKNEGDLLPLKANNIALIGPLMKDKDTPLASWRAQFGSDNAVSLYEGLTSALEGKTDFRYAEGVKLEVGESDFMTAVQVNETDKTGFDEAIRIAKSAQVVVMALGETAYMSAEGRSRADIDLPGLQLDLLKEVYRVNPNIVLVLMNGRPLTLPWEAANIPAIVEAWHLGSEAGHAIADVLTGKVNPSGKLTMSFPRTVGQLPLAYNHKSTGRPYSESVFYSHFSDVPNTALFPFGYGLSYTTFSYGEPTLSSRELAKGDSLVVSVEIQNTGNRAGKEVVQLYIRDEVASVTLPVMELAGFEKITLEAGESRTVKFTLSEKDLAFYDQDLNFVTEAGDFTVMVGPNSRDVQEVSFSLNEGNILKEINK